MSLLSRASGLRGLAARSGRRRQGVWQQRRAATYMLQYEYVEGILEKRVPHRPAHLALAKKHHATGELLQAGAFGDAEGACFVFECADAKPVEAFAASDPYVKAGLVTAHRIREWMVVPLKD